MKKIDSLLKKLQEAAGKWYENYDDVVEFGAWLVENEFYKIEELQWYYEKPWKWTKEWEDYQRSKEQAS